MTFLPGLAQTALPTTVVWAPAMTAYNFGHSHPMAPERMELTAKLAGSLGLLALDHVTVAAPEVATDEELCTVHTPEFVDAVRRVSENPEAPDEARGLGTEDDPAFAGMHEASARLAGGSLLAAAAVLDGSARAGSASTTTPPWPSSACSTAASGAWRTSTSMRTTATGRRASSGTTLA